MTTLDRQSNVHGLRQAEKLMVWAMRVWVVGVRERISVDEVLRGSFAKVGALPALPVLDNLMAVIAGGAARKIDISCVCNEQVSADEQCLLDVIALFQAGDTLETPLMLRSFLSSATAEHTATLVARLAGELSRAGLRLQPSVCTTRRYALHAGPAPTGWAGNLTVH